MSSARRFLTAITAAIILAVAPYEASASGASVAGSIDMVGMTADEQAAILHDVALFAAAGLPLPPFTIVRHHDRRPCNNFDGLHHDQGTRSLIDICTSLSGQWEARLILHELTHAWASHSLDNEHRQAFKALRGWTYWMDYDHATWEENGAEQAAEIMVWALSDHPVAIVRIGHRSCEELRAGYVALTGREPLHQFTRYCDTRAKVQRS